MLDEDFGLLQQLYDTSDIIMAQSIRGDLKYRKGDSVQAQALYQEALQHANASADKRKTGRCLVGLAQVFLAQEIAERATYLLGAAAACLKPYDMYPEQYASFQQTKDRLYILLGEVDFARIWEEGNSATREQILSTL